MIITEFSGKNQGFQIIGNYDINDYLEDIRGGKWASEVAAIRQAKDKEELKNQIGRVTFSGEFKGSHAANNLKKHSGFVCLDFDSHGRNKGVDMKVLKKLISESPYTYACWFSCSGNGLTALFRIDGKRHEEAFEAIRRHFLNGPLNVELDRQYKAVGQMKNHSFDPDIYINKGAELWNQYISKEAVYKKSSKRFIWCEQDIEFILDQLKDCGHEVFQEQEYYYWIDLGNAIASEFGQQDYGLELFLEVSSYYPGYDEEEARYKYSTFGRNNELSQLDFKYFFWYMGWQGLQTKHPDTTRIISVVNSRLRMVGKSGGSTNTREAKEKAKGYLIESGVNASHVDEVIGQIRGVVEEDKDKDKGSEELLLLDQYITEKNIKYNTVDKYLYKEDGNKIDEAEYNTMYTDFKMNVCESIKSGDFDKYIKSNYVPKWNPLKEYFSQLVPEDNGYFEKMINIIKFDSQDYTEQEYVSFSGKFILLWMLSLIDSMKGTPSSLVLVLVSAKGGTGKTMFFENLLPTRLKDYMSKPSLVNFDKDFSLILVSNILTLIDELDISKKNLDSFKGLTGGDTLTVRPPYHRTNETVPRLSTLCATSNKMNIIKESYNRRLIPITVENIPWQEFKALNKDKLFANLLYLYNQRKQPGMRFDASNMQTELSNYTKNLKEITNESLIARSLEFCDNFGVELLTLISQIKKNNPRMYIDLNLFVEELRKKGFKQVNGKWNLKYVYDYANSVY